MARDMRVDSAVLVEINRHIVQMNLDVARPGEISQARPVVAVGVDQGRARRGPVLPFIGADALNRLLADGGVLGRGQEARGKHARHQLGPRGIELAGGPVGKGRQGRGLARAGCREREAQGDASERRNAGERGRHEEDESTRFVGDVGSA